MRNIKIIEDKNNMVGNGIKIKDDYALFSAPVDIQDAEEWEAKVEQMGVPYVLAEVTMKVFDDNKAGKFMTGYMLFLRKDDLTEESLFYRDNAEALKEEIEWDELDTDLADMVDAEEWEEEIFVS